MARIRDNWLSFAALLVLFASTRSTHGSVITLSAPAFDTATATPETGLLAMQVSASIAASALPTPAANGMTKYEEVVYLNHVVAVFNKTTTVTLLSTPTAVQTYTAEHGASSRLASAGPGRTVSFALQSDAPPVPPEIRIPAFIENCTMNTEEKKGVCVREAKRDEGVTENGAPLPNFLWTVSGPLEAYATATIAAGSLVVSQPGRAMAGVGLLFCFMSAISAGLLL